MMTNANNTARERCPHCRLVIGEIRETGSGPLGEHAVLGIACWMCRDTHDASAKILEQLAYAQGYQLNQRTMAGKMGRTALSLSGALRKLSSAGLIERAYSNPNLERPSATTYRLTAAGREHMAVRS